jgi:hypothetical protein
VPVRVAADDDQPEHADEHRGATQEGQRPVGDGRLAAGEHDDRAGRQQHRAPISAACRQERPRWRIHAAIGAVMQAAISASSA